MESRLNDLRVLLLDELRVVQAQLAINNTPSNGARGICNLYGEVNQHLEYEARILTSLELSAAHLDVQEDAVTPSSPSYDGNAKINIKAWF